MNPPPLPRALAPAPPALAPGERLWPTLVLATCAVALGDYLFWGFTPGLSLAVYVAVLTVLLVAKNWRSAASPRVWVTLILLLVSAGQTAIELSLTNLAVIAALCAVLVGELYFASLPAGWARWSESLVAWLAAPGRWPWLLRAIDEQPLVSGGTASRFGGRLVRGARIAVPALALLILFAAIFASGNRVFSDYLGRGFSSFIEWLLTFDFSIPRALFWLFLATVGLAFFRPRPGPKAARAWARPFQEWRRADAGVAFGQSVLILAALNALFFAVNTIDVIYLWRHAALPTGVDPKAYLHEGVHSLIAATVLAAIVLTFLFQQPAEIMRTTALHGLALAWVAQNLLLIAGVFLRLNLYLDLGDMTEKRVYVGCFLLLVSVGFLLLCAHVWRGREAGRLIWRNVLATFALFFVLQFLNVADWVCRHNFARSFRVPQRFGINVAYNLNLGPSAWPALLDFAGNLPPGETRDDLVLGLRELAHHERAGAALPDWRERQLRRDRNAAQLWAWAQRRGELTAAERQAPIIERFHRTRRELALLE